MTQSDLQHALELIAAGQRDPAIEALRALRDDPRAMVRLRELLVGENRVDEAAAIARNLSATPTPEAAVSRSLLAFFRDDWRQALIECQAALDQDRDLATAHNHAGRALHNLGEGQKALAAFQKALQLDPKYPEAWHNLGHAKRAQGDLDGAVQAYSKAITLAPGFIAAQYNLGITLFNVDQVEAARQIFETILHTEPDHPGALVDGGLTLQLMGRFDVARQYYERALTLQPNHAVAHFYLGRLHNELMDTQAALKHLKKSLELDPSDVEAWIELTGVYEQSNRLDEAIAALGQGFQADPHHPALHLEGAKLERRRNDAAAAVRRLRALDPQQMPKRQAQQYWFELGQSLDRANESDAAVSAFTTGNQLARNSIRSQQVDPDAFQKRCRDMETWLKTGAPGSRRDATVSATDQVAKWGKRLCFLVGFPRSGTTLVDTTLATHPGVDALEEAATLDIVIDDLATECAGYPAGLSKLSGGAESAYRRVYGDAVKRLLGHGPETLLIDKMPLRFLHAGLIQRLFPDSRMVFVMRHPCDVVLSNFMQQYAVNETNIHFDSLANAAGMYARIMALWELIEATIQPNVHYVRYEDLVADMPLAINGVAEFLGLDPTRISLQRDARLNTRERVTTSSYQQVAEPLYNRAAGRWERYRQHLQPLIPILQPSIARFGYQR